MEGCGKPNTEPDRDNVIPLNLVPRTRTVPWLTDEEITQLRAMLVEFDKIKEVCPVAKRALSNR